jgi:hypothetical protein
MKEDGMRGQCTRGREKNAYTDIVRKPEIKRPLEMT